MNKISKLLTILCFIGFGLCLTGCSDGSSSASTKGLNIYLFGAPEDSHWNIWCWNKDSGTPYSSKSWDESKASGWEFSIDEIDAEKGQKEISEVFLKGYKMGDRVIRHTVVKVVN